jgi:DNA-binding GntR family transcriptional regulator
VKKLKIPSNLTRLAYNSIKEYILDGRLDENSRLTEEFLSTQLGISKSPIREALNRLEAEGLIHIEPRKGAYLRRLRAEEVSDLYDLREALEASVIRTARLSPELFADLRQSLKHQRAFLQARDQRRYIDEDVHFHAELARATGNAQLCAVLENIHNQIWLVRRNTYDLSSQTPPDDHETLVKALEAGDLARAESIVRNHIRQVRQRLFDLQENGSAQRLVG